MKLFVAALLLGFGSLANAQTWFTVAGEGDTVSSTVPITYRYGTPAGVAPLVEGSTPCADVAGCWDTPVTSTGVIIVGTALFNGVDPAYGTLKVLQILESSVSQTVNVNGNVLTVTQALCSLPTTFDANPVIPAVPANCPLPDGAVKIASDGDVANVLSVAAPVYFIYCLNTVCNAPFMLILNLDGIGPWKRFGGPPIPGQTGIGILYLIPGVREVTIAVKTSGTTTYVTKTYPAKIN